MGGGITSIRGGLERFFGDLLLGTGAAVPRRLYTFSLGTLRREGRCFLVAVLVFVLVILDVNFHPVLEARTRIQLQLTQFASIRSRLIGWLSLSDVRTGTAKRTELALIVERGD